MLKKPLLIIVIVAVLAAVGYLFVYPYDYVVRFTANSFPGTINQSIKIWHQSAGVLGSELTQSDLRHVEHQVQVGDSIHRYRWEITPLTDSTSRVVARIRDTKNSLANKIQVLFGGALIEKQSEAQVRDFAEKLNAHINLFRVRIVGEAEMPSTFYAYINLKTSQHGKAAGMMDSYQFLTDVLQKNQVALNGPPMIVVNAWNRETDSLDYNFCFPIIRSDRLPEHPEIEYKRIFPNRALKAEYNGNYITSDRAWYALMDYAEAHGIAVDPTPVEVFFNNPTLGGDALRWKAEIYLPIVEED